ncbi:MAG: glycosyltransferase family 39 protein [Candidatus Eisenbacteria bacterium]|nr:glycosyltransferase family 39 protein [Candidatus Eisenbacteria bacterium]
MNADEFRAGPGRPPLLETAFFLAAGLLLFSIHLFRRPVLWDEFLWYPEIVRVARTVIGGQSLRELLAPTRWQYPPLFFLAAGALVRLFGASFAACRALPALSSALLAPLAFAACGRAVSPRAGRLAALFLLTSPLLHRYGSAILVDPAQAALLAGALALYLRAETERKSLAPSAALAALAVATKYTSALLPASLLALLLFDRLRPGAGENGRRRGAVEIALFAALSFAPLLFLRRSDLELMREMTVWRSLPFGWSLFLRIAPIPLPLLALAAPAIRRRFPRPLRGAWLFFLCWSLFFLWRRQQMNWYLPALFPSAILAGALLDRFAGAGRRALPWLAAVPILAWGGYRSGVEILDYRAMERIYVEAGELVNRNVPPSAPVVADALPFRSPLYVRRAAIDARDPAFRRGAWAVLVPWVAENYRIRGFRRGAWGEVHEGEIRRSWRPVRTFERGGRIVLEIYENPDFRGER